MRIAGLVIGLIGGVIGLPVALSIVVITGVAGVFGHGPGDGSALFAFAVALAGVVGPALSLSKPRVAAACMVATALLGPLVMHLFYLLSTLLLLLGAALVLASRSRRRIKESAHPYPVQ